LRGETQKKKGGRPSSPEKSPKKKGDLSFCRGKKRKKNQENRQGSFLSGALGERTNIEGRWDGAGGRKERVSEKFSFWGEGEGFSSLDTDMGQKGRKPQIKGEENHLQKKENSERN